MSTESVLAAMFASPALNVSCAGQIDLGKLFPLPLALLKLATVLFLILVFVPAVSPREVAPEPLIQCIIDVSVTETWGSAFMSVARSYAKSFWIVFRLAFPLMILAAVLGAFAVELIPPQALTGQASVLSES